MSPTPRQALLTAKPIISSAVLGARNLSRRRPFRASLRSLFLLYLLVSLLPASSFAQVPTGTPPFGSFGGGPDVINLANFNSHITIPIINKPGRGMNFSYALTYDSSIWFPVGSSGNQSWSPVLNSGWSVQTQPLAGILSFSLMPHSASCVDANTVHFFYDFYYNWNYRDSMNNNHSFGSSGYYVFAFSQPPGLTPDCQNGPGNISSINVTATDGSGLTLWAGVNQNPAVWTTHGQLIMPPVNTQSAAATQTDRNGNQILVSSNGTYTDTLGTTVLATGGSGTPISPYTFAYTAPSGANATYTMKYATYTLQTNFACPGISEYGPTSNNLVSEIDLPDGSKYIFLYEQTPGFPANVTGRLASVTLPTGGTITYIYNNGNFTGSAASNGIVCADGSTAGFNRQTPDGTWAYARLNGIGAASTATITAPQLPYDSAANQTVIQFQGIYETQRLIYQGSAASGTLLRSLNTCYNGAVSPCTGAAVNAIFQRTVIDQYSSSGLQCKHNYLYNSFGRLTELDDYDYGSGAPGPLLKKTLITYPSVLSTIHDLPATVQIQNGSGIVLSQTTYSYDETTPTATSGVLMHTSPSGSRGNLTSINQPVIGLTSHFTYYDTGSIKTGQDVNGATTTYNYLNNTADCQMAFPTSVTEPINGLSTSATWNCTGGVQLSSVDENGQTTTTTFNDPFFWRPASASDPTNAVTSLIYTGQTAVESLMTLNSGSAVDQLSTMDGLGRSHVQQTRQSPSSTTYDSVEADYDALGRPSRTTLPYSAPSGQTCPSGPSCPSVTTTYDALSRPLVVTDAGGGTTMYSYANNDVLVTVGPAPTGENTKRRQLEYDSLGRLTSVCEITTGATPWLGGNCAQNNPQTGYWTKYTYDALGNLLTVTQNAQSSTNQQTRTYTFDAMSRLTSEKNPEMSQVATTYAYDSDTTCTPAATGDLVKRVDPVGNISCYSYDAMHRLTSVAYSGPYAANTPNKYFVYDAGNVNSIAMLNGKTHVIEAYTATTQAGTKITDLGFSYTVRGELADVYESTPHSSGYYHLNQTYWPHGAPSQLGNNILTLPAFTYGVDGEGRINTVSASAGQNPITGVTYNSASLPTQVTFGSADTDIFAYDPNTLRMNQFQFNVGTTPQSLVGTLTWNANSTLGQLAITDPFNNADTQTCNYGHDDMTRIASANCGTAAAQTFSYDPFGNISKSGSPNSFQPTYSAATNQMTNIAGFTPSYDANGNVLNDSNHTYTWAADNNSITVDSVGVTYDALNRAVEQNRAGVFTQIVYSPTGAKLALMNGQSLVKAFVPLPGQATAVYTSAGLDHYRHSDWLGSARLTSSPSRTFLSGTAYAPFGETYDQSGTADLSFTGQNSDTSSGDYDFPFREYSTQGRWASPDPAGLAAVDPSNPQSWNRYAYVLNNPLRAVDPSGLECVWDDGSYDSTGDPQTGNLSACQSTGGTWIDHSFFSDFGLKDWSGAPVGDLATIAWALQNGFSLVQTGQGINGWMLQQNATSGNSSGGFFSGIKDKFLDFLARNANYLPGVCTAGGFLFGTGGGGNANGGAEGGVLIDKQIGKATTVQPIGEVSYGPVGVGVTPSEALVFVQPAPKVPVGAVFAADWHNGFINNSGISIGLFAGKFGHGKGLAGGFGGGGYLTFSSAANCVKNF